MDALTLMARRTQLADLRRQIEGNRKAIDATLETLDLLIDASEGRAWIAAIRQARVLYAASSANVLRLMDEDRLEEAIALMSGETVPALEALQSPIKNLLELQKRFVPAGRGEVKRQIDSALTLMTVFEGAPSGLWQSALDES